jgi:hypothetical protein
MQQQQLLFGVKTQEARVGTGRLSARLIRLTSCTAIMRTTLHATISYSPTLAEAKQEEQACCHKQHNNEEDEKDDAWCSETLAHVRIR